MEHRRTGAAIRRQQGEALQVRKGKTDAPRGDTLAELGKALDVTPLWLREGVDLSNHGATAPLGHVDLRVIPVIDLTDLSSLRSTQELASLLARDKHRTMAVPDVGPRAMALRLDDNSMADKFPEGLLIVCDPDLAPVPGKYVVAVSHKAGRAVFRRYKSLEAGNGKAALLAENKDFPVITLASKRDGFIVGRVVGTFQRL